MYKPLTMDEAIAFASERNATFAMNDEKNADGTAVRWRVNGKVKTWKTRPGEFKIPVKHGMYDYGYITEKNLHMFHLNGSCRQWTL